ncbi:MAG: hypothetical protein QOI82_83 [Actinomycetota bacterium]|nr:hypothetical protein [Actinomycetota bacterium]
MRPGRGALRLARTLLVVLPSTILSSVAHASAGGCVTVAGVALFVVLLGSSTWTQLSRERSTTFLLTWLGLGQVLGHGLLELTCRGPAHAAESAALPMLGLHSMAVVLTAFVLAGGERRLWALARLLETLQARLRQLALQLVRRNVVPITADDAASVLPWSPLTWLSSPWCSLRPVRRGPPGRALSAC